MVAGGCLLLFWAVAGLVLAPRLLHRLEGAASAALGALEAQSGGARFDRVSVRFDGQRARLHGAVRSPADARRLLDTLRADLRTPGNNWNPVTAVAADSLTVRPLDPGWLLAAVRGYEAEVVGVCASEAERRALEGSLRRRWPTWRGRIDFALQVDGRRFDESKDWLKTVQNLPAPEGRGRRSAKLLAAPIGGLWRETATDESATPPAALKTLGLSGAEWKERGLPLQTRVREHLLAEIAWEAEQERLRALPPAHVFLARRGDHVLLRGEVFDLEAKRALFSAVMAALPGCRILDDLRAAGARRPGSGPGVPAAEALATDKDGKVLALGLPGRDWTRLDWEVARDAEPWRDALPPGLDAKQVAEDSALVIDWLQGAHAGIPALPAPPRPAFVTLAAYAGRVVVGGQLAEEALRAQLLEAVKRAYPTGWSVRDEVEVTGACAASADVQHTAQSVPVAAAPKALLAVAIPGQPWRVLSERLLLDSAALAPDALPAGLTASLVTASLQPALEEMRALGFDFPNGPADGTPDSDDKP